MYIDEYILCVYIVCLRWWGGATKTVFFKFNLQVIFTLLGDNGLKSSAIFKTVRRIPTITAFPKGGTHGASCPSAAQDHFHGG